MTPKQKWELIPQETRQRVLTNVWCSHCGDVVKFGSYRVYSAGGDIVLRGTCCECNGKVARVLEGHTLKLES